MTFLDQNQANYMNKLSQSAQGIDWGRIQKGLLDFVKSPEAQALGAGLLSQASPSMTEPRSIAGGLSAGMLAMPAYRKEALEREKVLQEAKRQKAFEDLLNGSAEVHPTSGKQIVNNSDGTISTENSITVTNPLINNGRPTNIPSQIEGQQLDNEMAEAQAIKAQERGQKFQSFNTIDEAVTAAKGRSAQLGRDDDQARAGLMNQQSSAPAPMGQPPAMPNMPSQNKLIRLNNGMEVTRAQLQSAQMLASLGEHKEAAKALTGDLSTPELIKLAQYAYPGDLASQQKFIVDAKLPASKGGLGDEATRAVVTKQQGVIIGVDSIVPSIDQLIDLAEKGEVPQQGLGMSTFSPNKQAKYKSLTSQAIEPLLGSFGLNSNEHNAKVVAQQIEKQAYESDSAYVERLRNLKEDLLERRKYATEITLPHGVPEIPKMRSAKNTPSTSNYSQEDLEYTAKKHGKTVEQVKRELEGK